MCVCPCPLPIKKRAVLDPSSGFLWCSGTGVGDELEPGSSVLPGATYSVRSADNCPHELLALLVFTTERRLAQAGHAAAFVLVCT